MRRARSEDETAKEGRQAPGGWAKELGGQWGAMKGSGQGCDQICLAQDDQVGQSQADMLHQLS